MFKLYKLINSSLKFNRSLSLSSVRRQELETNVPSTILVEKDANITLIGINRPQKRNGIDSETAQRLTMALHEFEEDTESPVAVLYGIGGSFCAGYDLTGLEKETEAGSLDFLMRHEGSVGPTRRHLRKPVVCGINGFCVGSGVELALLCDLRVMEENAVLGFFNRRLGVPLSDGGTARLTNAVGISRAIDIISTGRRVSAAEALKIGLVNRIVATGTSLGQAVHLAFTIAKFPQASLLHDRNSLYENVYNRQGFRTAIQNEVLTTSTEVLDEIKEGVQRFKNSKTKGAKTDSWNIREKIIPDWEKEEIAIEKSKQKE